MAIDIMLSHAFLTVLIGAVIMISTYMIFFKPRRRRQTFKNTKSYSIQKSKRRRQTFKNTKSKKQQIVKEKKHLFLDINQIDSLICGYIRHYQAQNPNMNIMTDLIICLMKQYVEYFKQIEKATFISKSIFFGNENKTYIAQFKVPPNDTYWQDCDYFGCVGIVSEDKENIFYLYHADGTKESHAHHGQTFSDDYKIYDKIFMKLEFDRNKDYGSLYFKKKNNKYMMKKGDNKWRDTKFKISKNVKFKIKSSVQFMGVWCDNSNDTIICNKH